MQGNMMSYPLRVKDLLVSAVSRYPEQEIVSRMEDDSIHRYTYASAYQRIKQLANALGTLGVKKGDRVGTLAWNNYRHLELYYAIAGVGAVAHTLNARLFADQINWIINHAEDRFIFVDPLFIPLLEEVHDRLLTVEAFIINCSESEMPVTSLSNVYCYESLIAHESPEHNWTECQENDACGLCYTSGTTGNPKGVMYSHRSTVLHAMMSGSSQYLDLRAGDSVMPVVPMYHVCAWGIPFSAPLYGTKIVFPGPRMDGEALQELIEQEQVNKAYGVPTVWLNLHNYLMQSGKGIDSLQLVGVGGAASPEAMIEIYDKKYGVYWMGIWGMTETGPLATAATPRPGHAALPEETRYRIQSSAGQAMFGVELEIFDDKGQPLEHDGSSSGVLKVRGPWVLQRYYRSASDATCADGWFDTGDVAVIDPLGYLRIVDRSKDVIKSGGEWISSVALENAALHDASVNEACVIGVPHPKWDERPVMLVTLRDKDAFNENTLRDTLGNKVAKWWMPDKIIVVDDLPKTGTGKLRKVELRQRYAALLR